MSWAIWITGLPGSGKSVLARGAAAALETLGVRVMVLELDEIRRILTPAPTYSEAERDVVYRALGHMAALLTRAGLPVIIDATAHRRVWRDLARAAIPRFAEVQLECPLEVCRTREGRRPAGNAPQGIYARARAPGATVPGVDVPYEPALTPELVVNTAVEDVETGVARVVAVARHLGGAGPPGLGAPSGLAPAASGRSAERLRVRDLIARAPIAVARGTPLFEARQRMLNERVRHLLVTDGGRLVGILSERDTRVAFHHVTVDDVMSRHVVSVTPDEDPRRAADIMLHHSIGALPVLEGERVLGVVTVTDLLRAFVSLESETTTMAVQGP